MFEKTIKGVFVLCLLTATSYVMASATRNLAGYEPWESGIIPYQIDKDIHAWRLNHPNSAYNLNSIQLATMQAETINEVLTAMSDWEALTSVTFEEVAEGDEGSYESYLLFTDEEGKGCYSSILGRSGSGEKPVWLDGNCDDMDAAHEIGHAMGLVHEHQRSGRDNWIEFKEENMRNFLTGGTPHDNDYLNFLARNYWVTPVGKYDYQSVMHYGTHSYARNSGGGRATATLWPLNPVSATIGYKVNRVITEGDIAGVELLYNRKRISSLENGKCFQSDPGEFFYDSNGNATFPISDHFQKHLFIETHINVNVTDCSENFLHQEWVLSGDGQLISSNGRCIGVSSSGSDAALIRSYICNGSERQRWIYDDNSKELRDADGRCLSLLYWADSRDEDPASELVYSSVCTSDPGQKWKHE